MGDVRIRARQFIGGIIRNLRCKAIAVGGVADHVHILVQRKPDVAETTVVRAVKSNSSRWIHETCSSLPEFAWQDGYAAFSVSKKDRNVVASYIAN